MRMKPFGSVEEYIQNYDSETQKILQKFRDIVIRIAPGAEEKISYGIPTYIVGKKTFHFGGYEKHVSIYPGATPIEKFAPRLKDYEISKGTVRFYLDKPIPYDLVRDIARYSLTTDS